MCYVTITLFLNIFCLFNKKCYFVSVWLSLFVYIPHTCILTIQNYLITTRPHELTTPCHKREWATPESEREWQEDPNLDILNSRPRPVIPHRLMTIAHFKHAPSAVQCAINIENKNLTLPWILPYSLDTCNIQIYILVSKMCAHINILLEECGSGSSNMCEWSESVEYDICSYAHIYITRRMRPPNLKLDRQAVRSTEKISRLRKISPK